MVSASGHATRCMGAAPGASPHLVDVRDPAPRRPTLARAPRPHRTPLSRLTDPTVARMVEPPLRVLSGFEVSRSGDRCAWTLARFLAHSRSCAIVRTAFVSTYPPIRCGIAAFTHDLAAVSDGREMVALHPPDEMAAYPIEVHHRIRRDVADDYRAVARALEHCGVGVVSIQHEYGIWGGQDGAYVLDFVRELRIPAVATLHTVLREPTPSQRSVLIQLINAAAATVVMSASAASLLTKAYDVDPQKIEVVPHGVLDLPKVDPNTIKPAVGLAGRSVILSFGLLGPGKGYELAIRAMPAVVAAVPNATYVILGATHPGELRRNGDAYRQRLIDLTAELGMTGHVQFIDRFVSRHELGRWLEAADVFVTPYPNLDQIVSGTLSYAMGAGKAAVSTPYAYAAEILANGRGLLVPPAAPQALATALIDLLLDDAQREAIAGRAYAHGRTMLWSQVGASYKRVFRRVAPVEAPRPSFHRQVAVARA